VPLDSVIEFKRMVYEQALTELARLLFHSPLRIPGWPMPMEMPPDAHAEVLER
jgi:hypothetical protein